MEQIKADHFNHDITQRKSSTGPLVCLLPQRVLNALAVFHVHLDRLAAFLASMEKLSWSPNNVLGFLIISVEQKKSSLGLAEMKERLGHTSSSSHSKDIMWPVCPASFY